HAALFAHGLGATGCVKATYGTGTSVMAPVDSVAFHVSNSHAALFAHGLGATGCVKATYGTGTSVMAPVDSVA
ncbi:hypothetical protein CKQ90_35875, partial [Klebsiella pneumoniae]